MNPNETSQTKIKKLLTEHLGVDPEEINEDDYFSDDLHMSATDLTDFTEILANSGFNTQTLDLTMIDTVGDLIEELTHEEL
jgi:acyl carrier protein